MARMRRHLQKQEDSKTHQTRLEVESVVAGYTKVDILSGCSLTVSSGEAVSLVGPNGAGKTTLLRVLGGVVSVRSGKVLIDGEDCTKEGSHHRARRGLIHVPEGKCVFPQLSVEENLAVGAYALGMEPRPSDFDLSFSLFPRLAERRSQAAGTLSGGEQRMLAIARGLMSRARILLLDEPSIGLAPRLVEQVGEACITLLGAGIAIILAEQNLGLVEALGGTALLVRWGRIEKSLGASAIRSDESVSLAVLGNGTTPPPVRAS